MEGRRVEILKGDLGSFLSVSVSLEQLGQLSLVFLLGGGSGGVESSSSIRDVFMKHTAPAPNKPVLCQLRGCVGLAAVR